MNGATMVVATIPVGDIPTADGVNQATGRIYVPNAVSRSVMVIDATRNTVLTTIPVGSTPQGVGVNVTTNRIYVTNF